MWTIVVAINLSFWYISFAVLCFLERFSRNRNCNYCYWQCPVVHAVIHEFITKQENGFFQLYTYLRLDIIIFYIIVLLVRKSCDYYIWITVAMDFIADLHRRGITTTIIVINENCSLYRVFKYHNGTNPFLPRALRLADKICLTFFSLTRYASRENFMTFGNSRVSKK